MRGFVAALGAVLVCGMIAATASTPAGAKETKEFEVGQWAGFVFSDDNTGQFVHCTAWAYNNNDVQVGIAVNKNWNLELWLNKDTWSLPDNQSYPISYWIDRNPLYHGKAATSAKKFVKVDVERGQDVFDEIRNGNQLTFRTQSDDYVFNLRGSNAALNRLLDCVDQYGKEANSNPFGDGSAAQQDNASQQGSDGTQQQQNGSADQASTSTSTMKLKSLTQSADQVRQFLVDVTGAKPSMITVEAKTYTTSGAPYYYFTTPIGQGEFWQEYLGDDALQDVALAYLDDYKKDCEGEVVTDPKATVKGEHGQLAVGTITCSDSPFQDGPEVLSYAMTTSSDVISIYLSYVGGNAAKAKTDSLGKLIARRSEDMIQ